MSKQQEQYQQRTDPAVGPSSNQQQAAPVYVYNQPGAGNITTSPPVSNQLYDGPPPVSSQLYGGHGYQPRDTPLHAKKSVIDAYILYLTLGLLGAHHFYLKRPGWGALYIFTFGLLGCGWLIDMFRLPYLVKQTNRQIKGTVDSDKKNISDAYTLWFPLGLLGFHHFYLNKPGFGVLYLCTLGGFGIGWLIDLFRMPYLVKEANESYQNKEKQLGTAYALGLSPFGLLGMHHFYLDRPVFGLIYFFTFAIMGFGYLVDLFRMPVLVKRANKIIAVGDDNTKFLDEAYVLWFPLGIIGAHHFYLRRPVWGVLYFMTFGLLGIGWLVDGCRMSCLVKDVNKLNEEKRKSRFTGGNNRITEQGVIISAPGAPCQPVQYGSAWTTGNNNEYTNYPHQQQQHQRAYPSQYDQYPQPPVYQPNIVNIPTSTVQGQAQAAPSFMDQPPPYSQTK